MILNEKGPRQESALKQKCVLWSLCMIVYDAVCHIC
jgi:hypothetical protein